ncbi:alpha/beta fold hydrolase [Brevibacterium sediminis]|uniref:thioesterase II family protein n=1 Tax=Brevibacterium sediminis TaxID=1857024 RepID=UPI00217521D2|nr:alpha/beta fold hydrolase [Brevibacterium sediminis]MCS4592676.1 alpha/beta fold hydrolase [Brevibacterium sediminis]
MSRSAQESATRTVLLFTVYRLLIINLRARVKPWESCIKMNAKAALKSITQSMPTSTKTNIVVFPHAGGSVSLSYLISKGDSSFNVIHVDYAELTGGDATDTLRNLAEALNEDLDAPAVLFGHSLGAYIISMLIKWLDSERVLGVIVSGATAPSERKNERPTSISEAVSQSEGIENFTESDLEYFHRKIAQDSQLMEPFDRVLDEAQLPYKVPGFLLAGDTDRISPSWTMAAWSRVFNPIAGMSVVPGGHDFPAVSSEFQSAVVEMVLKLENEF